MWISIIGIDGSGKNSIASYLIKSKRFKDISVRYVPDNPDKEDLVFSELKILGMRFDMHFEAYRRSDFDDFVSVRSAFDSLDFYPEFFLKIERISRTQFRELRALRDFALNNLPVPDCVIFIEVGSLNAISRMKIRNLKSDLSDEELNIQSEIYSKIADQIAIPLIRVDINQNYDDLIREIDFGLNSIRAANLSNRTIFKRDYYR